MKNLLLSVLFMLSISFVFANTKVTHIDVNKVKNAITVDDFDTSKDILLGCTSTTVTVVRSEPDGSTTTTTTTTVECDTPSELAQYTAALMNLK
jgi:hypothetical protein